MIKLHSGREYLKFYLSMLRCIPHLMVYSIHRNKAVIKEDIRKGLELMNRNYSVGAGLIYLLTFSKAFRNIFYLRTTPFDLFLSILCPPLSSMTIQTPQIGAGFAISHGYASAIGAKSIGKNFTVFQQVTIGAATSQGFPTILDNVTIYAGAIVIGNITIGNNVVIGANSTVYRDVPDNSTVLPGTSKVMKWKAGLAK